MVFHKLCMIPPATSASPVMFNHTGYPSVPTSVLLVLSRYFFQFQQFAQTKGYMENMKKEIWLPFKSVREAWTWSTSKGKQDILSEMESRGYPLLFGVKYLRATTHLAAQLSYELFYASPTFCDLLPANFIHGSCQRCFLISPSLNFVPLLSLFPKQNLQDLLRKWYEEFTLVSSLECFRINWTSVSLNC